MEFIESSPNIFRLLFHERSGTTHGLRTAVAREIQYFVVELTDYICAIGYDKESAFAQAEAMVAVVFNAGAESLDAKTRPAQTNSTARGYPITLHCLRSQTTPDDKN